MRRLTYAPKAFVYIRSRQHGNQVFDVSDYVVSGTVDRLVNQPSKATVILRNSFFQFSSHENKTTHTKKGAFFLPMDGITIWLQRVKNKPIQVFTGYLDSVPLLQLFPGNCQITATCTLKRLEHTYFDPSIQATSNFFQLLGWQPEGNGTYTTRGALIPKDAQGHATPNIGVDAGPFAPTNDSGIANVLNQFLYQIAGWDFSQIHISDLPPNLPQKAAKLYDHIAAENVAMSDGLEAFMKGMMTISTDPTGAGAATTVALGVVGTIVDAAGSKSVDPTIMTLAALALSGLDETKVGPNGEAGLYQCPNKHAASTGVASPNASSYDPATKQNVRGDSWGGNIYDAGSANYDGVSADKIFLPAVATALFANRMIAADKGKAFSTKAKKGDIEIMIQWIAAAAKIDPGTLVHRVTSQTYGTAKRLVSAFSGAAVQKNSPIYSGSSVEQLPDGLVWKDSARMFSTTKFNDIGVYHQYYKNAFETLAPYAYVAHKNGLMLVKPPKQIAGRSDIIAFIDPMPSQEKATKIKQFFDWAKTQGGADLVRYQKPDAKNVVNPKMFDNQDTEYHNGLEISGAGQQQDWPAGIVYVQTRNTAPYPTWTGNPDTSLNQSNAVPPNSTTSPSDPTPTTHPATWDNIATMGIQAAFLFQTSFPGNSFLSNILRGDKALMNDIPVMEGVKQLCGGSMRNFMSLPDGSFCAFYPDYFGADNRKPYWSITNMEIIDLGIQLNDQALATHVYVTGSLTNPGGNAAASSDPMFNDTVLTLGVVTLQHMFGDGNFVAGDIKGNTSGDYIGREMEAYSFLKFYGARPLSVQQPLIRNAAFEFLYAWQLFMFMWAKQFQTHCEFTFQPELMAGGRVAFPDHSLEMYIDSVHHAFSYESGFTTSAVLMAPASHASNPKEDNYLPGMALVGSVQTVGS